jgi:hypothetical protein
MPSPGGDLIPFKNVPTIGSKPTLYYTTFGLSEVEREESAWRESDLLVRHVRGDHMRSERQLFDEFSAAFQFPWYFGGNSNAFDECMTDLDWLPRPHGYIISVYSPLEILADATDDPISWLARRFMFIRGEWEKNREFGTGSIAPPTPINFVFHCGEDYEKVATIWVNSGFDLLNYQ